MLNDSVQNTHILASKELVGRVNKLETGKYSETRLITTDQMIVDDKELVHGGFTFSLADLAAMVAVNDPYVVLKAANVKFLKPVVCGDELTAKATVTKTEKERRRVWCDVFNEKDEKVFEGEFICISLKKHILER